MDVGVMYVAYGAKARTEAIASIATLRAFHDWPILVIGDTPIKGARFKAHAGPGTPGRNAKTHLDKLTDFQHTLFLDADTRIHGKLDIGFNLLAHGWALVCVQSAPQHHDALRHLSEAERLQTLKELPLDPLQLNTGVLWFDRDRAAPLFASWRTEWERWQDKDQGALLRALYKRPVQVALLGHPFNSANGAVVEHRFGACNG